MVVLIDVLILASATAAIRGGPDYAIAGQLALALCVLARFEWFAWEWKHRGNQ